MDEGCGITGSVDVLTKIKKLVIAQRVVFTSKARAERLGDGLSVEEILESIINAIQPSDEKALVTGQSRKEFKNRLRKVSEERRKE